MIVRIGIHRKTNPLAFLHITYIRLIHIRYYLHLRQVGGNGKQRRGLEAGGNGLSFLNSPIDNHSVYRARDRGIFEITVYLYHGGLTLVVSGLRLLVIIGSRLIIRIANQLFLVKHLATCVVLLLILELRLAARQLRLGGTKLGLEVDLIHLGDQLAGFHHVVIISVQLIDDTGDLRTYLNLGNGLYRTGGRNRIRDRAAPYFSGLQLDPAFRGFAREKEHAPRNEDNGNTAHD